MSGMDTRSMSRLMGLTARVISVCSATVPGHVGPFRVLCLGPGLLCN